VEKSIEEISNKAYEMGRQYERECTGCAQTTIAGIFDALNIYNEDVFKAASGLADGLGLTRDGTCGSLNGGAIVIGYLFGRERKDFSDMMKPMKSYMLSKRLHDEFVEKYGTCRCYDIQQRLMGRSFDLYDPNELQEAMKIGMFDYCSKLVGETARMATRIILEQMEKDSQE
jgi:C_GCAxxG_C_C family probable redox protein